MRLLGVSVAGTLVAMLIVAGVPACHADGEEVRSLDIPLLEAGRLLLKAGRPRDARAVLEEARPADENERIERLFLLGLAEAQLGLLSEAAGRFEKILASRPDLTRVRLELARIYFRLGRDEKARYHFDATMADGLPSSVEDAVERFLGEIDARKRWSFSISGAVLPETNPVKRTDGRKILIGGIPFELDDDARASSGIGFLVSAGGSYSPRIAGDWRGVLALSTASKLYRRSAWNDIVVQGEAGLARLFGRGTASAGIRVGRRWLGGDPYSREIGPWARGRMNLTHAIRLDMDLGASRTVHRGRADLDSWRFSARPGLRYALDAATAVSAHLDLETVRARARRHGSRLAGLGISVSHAFEGGLSISSSLSAHIRHYAAADPLFQKPRCDRQTRLSANVLHRALQVEGFAPYLGVSFEWNHSNIPISTYRNRGLVFGISRSF